jgi:hypothetical protein
MMKKELNGLTNLKRNKMKSKEKIDNAIWESSNSEVVSKLETVADDFAIGFAEWLNKDKETKNRLKELLEIYKNE